MACRREKIGYFFLLLILCNSVATTYASIEHNAKAYGQAKFLNKVHEALKKASEPSQMQAKVHEKIGRRFNLSPPRVVEKIGRASHHVSQQHDASFLELQTLTNLEQLIDNSLDKLRPAHLSSLMAMLETSKREAARENDDEKTDAEKKFGTLRVTLKRCKVTRDMDSGESNKNDMYVAVKVGGNSARSMRKITLVHDNTEEIDFEGKVDSVLEFKNVEFEELKHFRLLALDDDIIGFDTIGRSRRQNLDTTDGYVTKNLYFGEDKKDIAGTITYKVEWTLGAVPSKGVEGKAYRAPWKRWTNFPDYTKNSELGSQVGSPKQRNKARVLGFVIGLFAGASAGLLDLVDNLGEGAFEVIEKNWGPVGEQWAKMEAHMGKAAKNPSFKNVKAALKELLMVAKVFLKFLWKVITTKEVAIIGLVIGMVAVFITVIAMLPTNFALMFTVFNALFSAWYIADQFVDIYKNLHKCDGGKCLLHHVYKGWGAVGRLIGFCLAEFLYMKSFKELWAKGKELIGKMNKGGASKLNIDKLTKATKAKTAPKHMPKPAAKPAPPKTKTGSYDPYAYHAPKKPKVETAEEIGIRVKKAMAKYKGRTKADVLTANPMGTAYYAQRDAKLAKKLAKQAGRL